MRAAFTLLELLFSMVIIGLVFTVFPKIIQLSAKTPKYTLKEEALYNGVALAGLIKNLPWDEKNTRLNDILITDAGDEDYKCDYAFANSNRIYRKGSFVGSRNCIHKEPASAIGLEEATVDGADDVDDFNGYEKDAVNYNGSRDFKLKVGISYIKDINITQEKFDNISTSDSTNLKFVKVDILPVSRRAKSLGDNVAVFWYISSNIGQLKINSQPWSGQ